MAPSHVVVDGSNIATEGRSVPSLRQLDDAVRQFQDEFPDTETIVVVDATFGHRIDASDRKAFDDAVAHGELVSPPAGAIGRGDAFVLRIAERVGGQVLSNDSFQEFHAEHPWLFDEGRLIGGKPVPGVGWIFTLRTPVRGPRSRAVAGKRAGATAQRGAAAEPDKATKGGTRRRAGRSTAVLAALEVAAAEATEAATAHPAESVEQVTSPSSATRSRRRRRRRGGRGDPEVKAAIEAATEEAITPPGPAGDGGRRSGRRQKEAAGGPEAVNDPLTFLTFIAEHSLGDTVIGTVSNFVSHGAMVDVGDMHCYVPLSGLAEPPPKSARAVVRKGDTRPFVVVALDPPRRGAQLALPDVVDRQGGAGPSTPAQVTPKAKKGAAGKAPAKKAEPTTAAGPTKKKAAPTKTAAKKAAPTKKSSAKTARPATTAAPSTTAGPAKKTAAEKSGPTKKTSAKKAAPIKTAAKKAAPTATTAPAKRTAAEKSGPNKKTTTKRAAPVKKTPSKKAEPAAAPKKGPKSHTSSRRRTPSQKS